MPKCFEKILEQNPGEKSLQAPFAIYIDLECLLKKEQYRGNNNNSNNDNNNNNNNNNNNKNVKNVYSLSSLLPLSLSIAPFKQYPE